jgi:hypothetical protein
MEIGKFQDTFLFSLLGTEANIARLTMQETAMCDFRWTRTCSWKPWNSLLVLHYSPPECGLSFFYNCLPLDGWNAESTRSLLRDASFCVISIKRMHGHWRYWTTRSWYPQYFLFPYEPSGIQITEASRTSWGYINLITIFLEQILSSFINSFNVSQRKAIADRRDCIYLNGWLRMYWLTSPFLSLNLYCT